MKGQNPMMIKYALALTLASAALLAQDSGDVTKVIHVRYGRAEAIKDLVGSGSVSAFANNGLRAIVLKGSTASVAAAEQAVKELDVPVASELARNVELTVYVIGASGQGGTESTPAPEIAPVVRQLKAVFPYGSYQLLDTMMIRTREGRSAASDGILKGFPNMQTASQNTYHVRCVLGERNNEGPERTVRLDKFDFGTQVPKSEATIDTNFDLQDGQKVVVGNTNIDGGNSALFVAVGAKFVQ
jgi:hypothetical protein